MISTAIRKGHNERAIVRPSATTGDKVEDHPFAGTVAGDGGVILTTTCIHAEIKNNGPAHKSSAERKVWRIPGGVKALARILV